MNELPSEIPTLDSTKSFIAPARHSLRSVPEEYKLMPPPECESSVIQNKNKKKRKCADLEADQVPESSSMNSTDIISTSIIRNSRETSYMSQENVVEGKRSRKKMERK